MSDPFAEIERLVDALQAPAISDIARTRSAELLDAVLAAHQHAIETIFAALSAPDRATLAADERVAPILLLHGLHPMPVRERVVAALEDVRQSIAPALDVDHHWDEGRLTIDLRGAGAEQASVKQAFERAALGAAPEAADIRVRVAVAVELSSRPKTPSR